MCTYSFKNMYLLSFMSAFVLLRLLLSSIKGCVMQNFGKCLL